MKICVILRRSVTVMIINYGPIHCHGPGWWVAGGWWVVVGGWWAWVVVCFVGVGACWLCIIFLSWPPGW